MNKLYTLMTCLSLGIVSFGQTVLESDLSSWTDGDPDLFMGSRTNIGSENVTESMAGVEHGTSLAQLFNASGDHARFTTESVSVTGGETYNVSMWLTSSEGAELRVAFYDETNDNYIYPNPYLDVFTETGGVIALATQTVNIPSSCEDGEFIFSLRNTDEVMGIMLDSVSIGIGEPVEVEEATIYEIQYATDPDFISPFAEEIVTTRGVVTGVFTMGGDEGRFFIQDGYGAWNGIYVYDAGTAVAIGDSVSVTGKVKEFFTLTEITEVLEINIISSGNPLPAAIEVSTADVANEEYEGVLVKVMDAECTNDDAGFGAFEVNDGSGTRLIDDEIFSYTATIGNHYNITGVTFLSFSETKVYPRSIADIEVVGYTTIAENTNEFSIYPNPASEILTVKAPIEAAVSIYAVTGELVYNSLTNATTIDVNGFDAGVYYVTVTMNEKTAVQQLIVK